MIKGIGCDIVSFETLNNTILSFPTFISHNYSKQEYKEYVNRGNDISFLAKRWAGKEAVIKAINDFDVAPKDIEILNDEFGKPYVLVKGFRRFDILISLSSDGDYAVAYVTLL